MALERVVQFRVSTAMERDLRADAATLGLSEAEALRHALTLLHRVADRQRHVTALMQQAAIQGGDPVAGFQ